MTKMSEKGVVIQMKDERLVTLAAEIRSVLDRFTTENRVPYASAIGVLRKVEHELMLEWCE